MRGAAVISLSILVADDEPGIRDLITQWLTEQGHSVVPVGSGQHALRLLKEQQFDLIITDIVMPDGDGFELIAAFRNAGPAARVLAISGGGRFLMGGDCLRIAQGLGANAVLMKPFTMSQLQKAVADALLDGAGPN